MTYVHCRGCVEKGREPPCFVPDANTVCCDCYLLTPQERQAEFERLRYALDHSQRTQRDRFAEAALARGHAPREAWDSADSMMKLRDKSYRERHGSVAHTCAANPDSCFQCGKPLEREPDSNPMHSIGYGRGDDTAAARKGNSRS